LWVLRWPRSHRDKGPRKEADKDYTRDKIEGRSKAAEVWGTEKKARLDRKNLPALKTNIGDLFGITQPIIQGGFILKGLA
jgi:hypothetical protein